MKQQYIRLSHRFTSTTTTNLTDIFTTTTETKRRRHTTKYNTHTYSSNDSYSHKNIYTYTHTIRTTKRYKGMGLNRQNRWTLSSCIGGENRTATCQTRGQYYLSGISELTQSSFSWDGLNFKSGVVQCHSKDKASLYVIVTDWDFGNEFTISKISNRSLL